MAPVIMSANLQDSVKIGSIDRLHLKLSEPVKTGNSGDPFQFLNTRTNAIYHVSFSSLSANGESITADMIGTSSVSFAAGDSIRILISSSSKVTDLVGLTQQNDKNIRRPITVDSLFEGVHIASSTFFDKNGDGKIDQVSVTFAGNDVGIETNKDAIAKLVKLPDSRNLTVSLWIKNNNTYLFDVIQNSATISTSISDQDSVIILADTIFADSTILFKSAVKPADAMAPVLCKATFIDSVITMEKVGKKTPTQWGRDSLELTYSEDVVVDSVKNIPLFQDKSFQKYRITTGSVKTADRNVTGWNFPWQAKVPVAGDSVRIDVESAADVKDLVGNQQQTILNRLVEVNVQTIEADTAIAAEFTYELKATLKNGDDKMVIGVVPSSMDSVSSMDSCWAENLTILDPVGNVVRSNLKMNYYRESGSLFYFWDGKNESGRTVGSGAYTVYVTIYPMFRNQPKGEQVLRGLIGVKK